MSNNAILGISVKDYANQRGKTIQAVYQQMKRKENAVALEGHIHLHRIGNKNVKYLDDKAVEILDQSSQSAPITIVEEGLKEELALKEQERKQWEAQAFKLQGQVELLKDMLAQKEQALRLLDEPKQQIDTLKAQNADLSADNVLKDKILEDERKNAQKLSDELTEANTEAWHHYRVALEIYNALPWWKKRRRSAPVPPNTKE